MPSMSALAYDCVDAAEPALRTAITGSLCCAGEAAGYVDERLGAEGRQPEPHRPILPGRIDAIHTEPQSRAVALLCEFNGLAGDGLGFTFHQGLGGHGNAMASASRLAVGISRLSFLKGHYRSNTFAIIEVV
jgi:hypothetical protein